MTVVSSMTANNFSNGPLSEHFSLLSSFVKLLRGILIAMQRPQVQETEMNRLVKMHSSAEI